MKATEQYFPVVLFIMLYKVVITFWSVNEILNSDSNEGSTINRVVQGSFYRLVAFFHGIIPNKMSNFSPSIQLERNNITFKILYKQMLSKLTIFLFFCFCSPTRCLARNLVACARLPPLESPEN